MQIFKTLPGGRRVEREVTPQEYIEQGWREQGWVAPASVQKKAEDHLSDQLFQAISEQPLDYLRGLAKHYTIVKKLPNGKWAKKTNIGGYDYEFGGWKNNGWVIPSWAHAPPPKDEPKDTARARAYYTRQIKYTQSAWKPKRTTEQAAQFLKGTWLLPGKDLLNYATQLRSSDKYVNPAYMKWQTRALKWARHNKRTTWKHLTTGTPIDKRHARFAIIRQFQQRRPAPKLLLTTKTKRYHGYIDIPRGHMKFAPWQY